MVKEWDFHHLQLMTQVVAGKISQEVKRTEIKKGLTDKGWFPFDFERFADEIDDDDDQISGDAQDKLRKYQEYGWPYLVSAGIEGE